MPRSTVDERFWPKMDKGPDCWVWIGSTFRTGRGQFRIGSEMRPAHRVAWELTFGSSPQGLLRSRACSFTLTAVSTVGTCLRTFRWATSVRNARAAGAGPGHAQLTIDFDSTICETCGPKKEGAVHQGRTGARG